MEGGKGIEGCRRGKGVDEARLMGATVMVGEGVNGNGDGGGWRTGVCVCI